VGKMVDVAYTSAGRIVARGMTDAQLAGLPMQTEVIPVLDRPMVPLNPESEMAYKLKAAKAKLVAFGANPIIGA
jgi:hypothetical protein